MLTPRNPFAQEELRTLRDSFSSVKAEFTDLDGLSWETPIARQILHGWVCSPFHI